jgi:hypothetical protein
MRSAPSVQNASPPTTRRGSNTRKTPRYPKNHSDGTNKAVKTPMISHSRRACIKTRCSGSSNREGFPHGLDLLCTSVEHNTGHKPKHLTKLQRVSNFQWIACLIQTALTMVNTHKHTHTHTHVCVYAYPAKRKELGIGRQLQISIRSASRDVLEWVCVA